MDTKTIHVEIVTPYELFFNGEVTQIVLTAIDGEIGIRPGHTPAIIGLNPGEIRMTSKNNELYVAASDGYADIHDDTAIVVVGAAEWPEQIDLGRAVLALERAQERLLAADRTEEMSARAKRAVLRAKARIKVAERTGKPKEI